MAEYWADDGGDNSTGASWATAYTSINALDAAVDLASGDIVNFGHDHVCQAVNGANLNIAGPTTGLPVIFRSATQGSDPVTYQKCTGAQIDTTEGAYSISFTGSFLLQGLRLVAGTSLNLANISTRNFNVRDCTFAPGANGSVDLGGGAGAGKILEQLVVDLTADGTTNRNEGVFVYANTVSAVINGLTFINAAFRTGEVFKQSALRVNINVTGADFSGFTNPTLCELTGFTAGRLVLTNCKTAVTWALESATPRYTGGEIIAINVGPTDDPTALQYKDFWGDVASSNLIYRSGGATIEGIANSWLVTTTANCNEYAPFHSPWLYSRVKTVGDKIVSLFIVNDTADFTDAEAWIEVEFLDTDDNPLYALGSDQRATITTTPVAQEDDTDSTWTGVGPAFTYKQKLSVPITVGEVGRIRARLVTGVASIASSRRFYLDPDSDHMVSAA